MRSSPGDIETPGPIQSRRARLVLLNPFCRPSRNHEDCVTRKASDIYIHPEILWKPTQCGKRLLLLLRLAPLPQKAAPSLRTHPQWKTICGQYLNLSIRPPRASSPSPSHPHVSTIPRLRPRLPRHHRLLDRLRRFGHPSRSVCPRSGRNKVHSRALARKVHRRLVGPGRRQRPQIRCHS